MTEENQILKKHPISRRGILTSKTPDWAIARFEHTVETVEARGIAEGSARS